MVKRVAFLVTVAIHSISWGLLIYSDRSQSSMGSLLEKLRRVMVVEYREFPSDALVTKVRTLAPGEADVVILKDLYYMAKLQKDGLLQQLPATVDFQLVRPIHRDINKEWMPITFRVRSLVYHQGVDPTLLKSVNTYQDLASADLKQSLCLRGVNHSYNIMLLSHLLFHWGFEPLVSVYSQWVNNLAKPYLPNDRSILDAILSGECDFGIINSYYLVQLLNQNPRLPLGFKFLDDGTGGSHSNGVTWAWIKGSRLDHQVIQFAQAVYEDEFQISYSQLQGHYPAKQSISLHFFPKMLSDPRLSNVTWNEMMESIDDLERNWSHFSIP
ncbi:MAG: extracellular solute-binding protein [Bdellovibrionaceae bacterium]|nr:extracellular solute-binding protein [Pseudobdellovibrionaceae bacterium]MDW8190680.1 hypothetical protein [Pseudobdellovibrionaceae bacterium]